LSYTPAKGDVTIENSPLIVKFWFNFFEGVYGVL
jgi:hypothetical protein